MDYLHALILGIVQGLTEFLPISSTAHLVITEKFFGFDPKTFGLGFNAGIQLGTTLAVIWYFRRDLWQLVTGWRRAKERRLFWMLVVATIPALGAGFLFKDVVENDLTTLPVIAGALVIGGVIFLITERVAKGRKTEEQAGPKDALIIGLSQCLAIVPGVSRSGSTIVPAMLLGLKRADAARFSFLLSIPVISAAGLYAIYDAQQHGSGGRLDLIAIGLVVSFAVGYVSIKYLLRYLARNTLSIFSWYRFALAAVIVIYLAA